MAGSAGLAFTFPIGLVIVGLLFLVTVSYFQTIHGYPSGGGSYIVAKDNLGVKFELVAGAALMIDYVLTAAVSLTAGVEAIASAFPALLPYRVEVALFLLAVITLINLRGATEAGTVMAVPVYLFLIRVFGDAGGGIVESLDGGPGSLVATALPATEPLTVLVLMPRPGLGHYRADRGRSDQQWCSCL